MSKKSFLIVLIGLSLVGCTKSEVIVLLPESDGSVGSLSVADASDSSSAIELDQAYAAARVGGGLGASLRASELSEDEVKARFGDVMAALPMETLSFELYFETGAATLSAGSQETIEEVKIAISQSPAAELEIVGHTDTVGDALANDTLSLQRAAAAREVLIRQLGLPADSVTISGRGERELAQETPDETANALNRRVELRLR